VGKSQTGFFTTKARGFEYAPMADDTKKGKGDPQITPMSPI
jgi:hypothetical protein